MVQECELLVSQGWSGKARGQLHQICPDRPTTKRGQNFAAICAVGKSYSLQYISTTLLRFQGNAWADIPAEVIEEVLDRLSAKDRWNSRLISSSWGLVVRGHKCSVSISVNASTLWSRARSFRQRQKQYPRTRFTLTWAKSLGFAACAEVLATIAVKARSMTLTPVTPAMFSLLSSTTDKILSVHCRELPCQTATWKSL